MTVSELIQARSELFKERRQKTEAINLEYNNKIEALNYQIERENKKGIKKRIKANTGKFL